MKSSSLVFFGVGFVNGGELGGVMTDTFVDGLGATMGMGAS